MQTFMRSILLLGCLLTYLNSSAQFVGGHAPSQPPSGKVSPSSLSAGPVSNSVDLFTGSLNLSYDFGSVATLSGLSFPLRLQYNNSTLTAYEAEHSSGIPFGEGWSLADASVSVETSTFDFQAGDLPTDNQQRKIYTPFQAGQVGKLFYANPRIQLPGGISGRLVYKYPHPDREGVSVFVLNGFETYIEVNFTGNKWEAVMPDGTVYVFALPQYRHRNPSNTTAFLADKPSETIVPKADITRWHLTEIFNPNHANGQKILFEYEGFGEIDPYQELQQGAVKHTVETQSNSPITISVLSPQDSIYLHDSLTGPVGGHGQVGGVVYTGAQSVDSIIVQASNPIDERAKVYSDIFLKSVTALDAQGGELSRVELKYRSWRPENELNPNELETGNFLTLNDTTVQRIDSLYNRKVVWFQGQDGSLAQTFFDRPAMPDTLVSFDGDWKRYMHPMAYQHPFSDREPILNPNNPFLFQLGEPLSGINPANNAWLWSRMDALNGPSYSVPFTHSVLESPRITGSDLKKMPSGDQYQLRTVVKIPDNTPNADINFDVRIASGVSPNHPLLQTSSGGWFNRTYNGEQMELRYAALNGPNGTFNPSGYFENGYEIFSTLRNIVKWNPAYQAPSLYAVTDNTFRLPNLPNEFGGFVVQIGPGSDNLEYEVGSSNDEGYFHRYNNFSGQTNVGEDDYQLRRANWFGTGAPLEPLFRTNRFYVNKPGSGFLGKGQQGERFLYWYLEPELYFSDYQMVASGPHQPTALTRERLNTNLNGSYSLTDGTMDNAHDDPWDSQLQSVEIARIAKNPFMLDSVIFTTQGGAYGYDRVKTSAFHLEYDLAQVPVLNNVNHNDTMALWASDYKLVQGDTIYRNIFRLAEIRRIGLDTNGSVAAVSSSATFFDYLDDDRSTTDLCEATMVTSFWNELGGKTAFTYNWGLADTALWNSNVSRPNSDESYQLMGGSRIFQRVIPIKYATVEDGAGGQTTEYFFFDRIRLQRGVEWDYHYGSKTSPNSQADRVWGFRKAVVFAPSLAVDQGRARTEYYYRSQTGTFADTLLFGRMYQVKQFDASGAKTSQYEIDYDAVMAYQNGQRFMPPYYANFGGNPIDAVQNKIYDYDPFYTWDGRYQNYMNSWFIYKTEERRIEYDPSNQRSITNRVAYTYYDWDTTRQEIGNDYLDMYQPPFGGMDWFIQESYFKVGNNEFSYHAEPSWQVASVTNSSDEVPGAYTKENYYYLWDIEPFLDKTDVYTTRYAGSMRPFYLARKNGIRNTLYENRKTTYNGDPDADPLSLSTYYEWEVFRNVPGDFVQTVDSTYYGTNCNVNDPGEFLREMNHAVVYCLGEGHPTERQRITQEIVDDPRYIQTQDSLWYFFPIESYAAMDFATFDQLPEFGAQNPNEVCPSGGFVVGPDATTKYFGDFDSSDGASFQGVNIKAAERNYGKYFRETGLSDESKSRVDPVVFLPHLHEGSICHKVHGFDTYSQASAVLGDTNLNGPSEDGQRQNFLDMLTGQYHLRAIHQQADTVFNTRTLPGSAPNPNYPSTHNLWDTVNVSVTYQGTRVRYEWNPTAPLIRTYHVHERNMHGQVVEESDVRHLHRIYEYAKGAYHYEFDTCGNPRSFIYRDFFGVPLSVTTTNYQEIGSVTVFDYYDNYQLREVIAPNGETDHYDYDEFGRLADHSLNGISREQFWFGKWNGDQNLSWNDRIKMNHLTSLPIREVGAQKQVQMRTWMDPMGRNVQAATGVFVGNVYETKEYDGEMTYDKWNRVIARERPQVELSEHDFNYEAALPATVKMELRYESGSKSRVLNASKFGNGLSGNHISQSHYTIITLDEFQQLTGATFYEMQEVFPHVSTFQLPKTKLYQTRSTDEDGKLSYAFNDALGRVVATLGFTDYNNGPSGKALTLFAHDGSGNLRKVIHPNKLESTRRYNVLGWMIEHQSPDAGTSKFFYNQAGDLKVMQDENLRLSGRFRVFDYDHAGRLLEESSAELGSSPTQFNNTGVIPLEYQSRPDLLFRSIHSIGDELYGVMGEPNFSFTLDAMQSQEEFPLIDFPRSVVKKQKAIRYDYPVLSPVAGVTDVPVNTVHPNLYAALNDQENTMGRVAAELVYGDDGALLEQSIFNYDDEGRGSWMARQFAKTGISPANHGEAHFIETEGYNLQGQPGRVSIDLKADGSKELQHVYKYDPHGRLSQVFLNKGAQDYLVAQYEYELGTGLTGSVVYFAHSADCPDPMPVDTVAYTYDDQSRMTKIGSHFFDFSLFYDASDPGNVQHHQNYNGAINGWKAEYDLQGQSVPFFNAPTTYGFEYDDLNRLRAADASIPEQLFPRGGSGYTASLGFEGAIPQTDPRYYGDAKYDYDASGNLIGLWRYSYFDPGPVTNFGFGDSWIYHYGSGTNQLVELRTGTATQANIGYDGNGNLVKDSRRELSSFRYNERNLPLGYRRSLTDSVSYLYGSGDSRIWKEVVSGAGVESTFYLRDGGGRSVAIWDDADSVWTIPIYGLSLIAEYAMEGDSSSQRIGEVKPEAPKVEKKKRNWFRKIRNILLAGLAGMGISREVEAEGAAEAVPVVLTPVVAEISDILEQHFEGRSRSGPDSSGTEPPKLKFFVQDHLGNIRVSHRPEVYFDSLSLSCKVKHQIVSVIDYYPYGKLLRSWHLEGQERYLTTEHERDRESGLDYRGARYYDADYGRFLSLDPLASEFSGWSPYNYVLGNPVSLVDPDGRSPGPGDKKGGDDDKKKDSGGGSLLSDLGEMYLYGMVMGAKKLTPYGLYTWWEDSKSDYEGLKSLVVSQWDHYNHLFSSKASFLEWANEFFMAGSVGRSMEFGKAFLAADNEGKAKMIWYAAAGASAGVAGGGVGKKKEPPKIEEFDPIGFADEIVKVNKTTDGGGVLLNGNPNSAINSALYYEVASEQGASIFRSISHGHMFLNGNKRTAVAAFQIFAERTGIVTVSRSQMLDIATKVAQGEITDVSSIAKLLTQ